MQNFGISMWRRVGNYARLNYNDIQLQRDLAFIKYQKIKQRQEEVNKYREHILKQANSKPIIVTNDIEEEIPDDEPNVIIIAGLEPDVFSQNINEDFDNYLEENKSVVELVVDNPNPNPIPNPTYKPNPKSNRNPKRMGYGKSLL